LTKTTKHQTTTKLLGVWTNIVKILGWVKMWLREIAENRNRSVVYSDMIASCKYLYNSNGLGSS
jgi:hypothetical protein